MHVYVGISKSIESQISDLKSENESFYRKFRKISDKANELNTELQKIVEKSNSLEKYIHTYILFIYIR